MESHRIARIANSPSINETIANLTEFSLHMGTIAFSEDYDFHGPEEISKGWIIGEPDEWPQEDPCSAVGLGRILNQSYNREEALKKKVIVLGKDVRLQEETYSELSRRLLRAGKTAKAIEAGSGGAGLRMPSRLVNLARILYRVQNPTRESTNAVACRVTTGLPGTHKDVAVRLPMTASLETINGMLRAFVLGEIICASKTVPETQLDDILGSWQYQLLAKSGKGSNLVMRDSRRVKLMKDADYRSMIKIVVEPGPVKMVPLLTPVIPYQDNHPCAERR